MTNPDRDELVKLADLRSANVARQKEWDAGNQLTLAYRGNELAGEVGEACNVIKKLERERLGIKGSRDTVAHLAEELADVVICADLIAMHEGIDLLGEAVPAKFNATSEKVGLKTRLTTASVGAMRGALERIADPRNIHFAGDAQVVARKALAAANQSDVEALAATTAERPGTVTSEPEPSTSDTPPAPQAVEAVGVDTIARICADDLVPIIETATRVANRTGNTFVIDRQKVATMIAGHFNRALLAKFKMEGR